MNNFLEICLKAALPKVTGILHVGAHTGQEAALYDSMGIRNVAWIEANPTLIDRLRANVEPLGHQVIEMAVGDRTGTADLYVTDNDGHSSSLLKLGTHTERFPDVHESEVISVPITTLDRMGVNKLLNFWVIDVQGAESFVLSGATTSLAFCDFLVCEFSLDQSYKGGAHISDLDLWLGNFTASVVWATKDKEIDNGMGEAFYERYRNAGMDLVRRMRG